MQNKNGYNEMIRLYESLSPTNHVDNGEEYLAALEWAIKRKDIHNIAISGPYGSGKSSVINAFLAKQSKLKLLKISLSSFNLVSDIDQDKLEEEILKQIIYSVPSKTIPKSRYRRIAEGGWANYIFPSIALTVIGAGAIYLYKQEVIDSLIEKLLTMSIVAKVAIPLLIFLFLVSFICFVLGWLNEHARIKEVDILKKTSIKMDENDSSSVFNKNMDDIVYYFEKSKTELVVFEDLDRFNNTDIFVALRNLNILLNNNDKIKGKLRFIYAIRDDLFVESGERTKFFDFIIPIIPYISSTNSGEILRKLLKYNSEKKQSDIYTISDEFITRISPYLSNMRDILCICNEFNIYKNTLKGRDDLHLKDENMFALIVFKNLFPKDFAELEDEKEESIIRTAFKNKKEFINSKDLLIEKNRDEETRKVKEAEKDELLRIRDLKAGLLMSLHNPPVHVYRIVSDGSIYEFSSIMADSFNIDVLKNTTLIYTSPYGNGSPITIKEAEKLISDNGDYFNRINRVASGLDAFKEQSQKRIEEYDRQISELQSFTLAKMISVFGTDFLSEDVSKNELLIFLLRNSYIDETYENYINYFHPNSITKEEMNYILGIRNHKTETQYSFHFEHVEQVFERLIDYELMQPEALNYEIVDHLLTKKSDSSHFKYLMEQLSNNTPTSWKFIKSYIHRDKNIEIFISQLCRYNFRFWKSTIDDRDIGLETEYKYLNLMMRHAQISDILKQDRIPGDKATPLSTFLTRHVDSLSRLKEIPVEKQIEVIEGLDLVFTDVDLECINADLVEYIFANNKYDVCIIMLIQLFKWKNPDLLDMFDKKNYSAIEAMNYIPLTQRIESDFSQYISDVFLCIGTNVDEDIEHVNLIIDRLLPNDVFLAIQVINKENAFWDDITQCCANTSIEYGETKHEIWKNLFFNKRVGCTMVNVQKYFDAYGIDDVLDQYFDDNINILIKTINDPSVTDELKNNLLYATMSSRTFRAYILNVKSDFAMYDYNDLGRMKTEILIKEHILPFSVDSWFKIKELWVDLSYKFAEENPKDFMSSISEIVIDETDIGLYLDSKVFSEKDKKSILNQFDSRKMTTKIAMRISSITYSIDAAYVHSAWPLLSSDCRIDLLINHIDCIKFREISNYLIELGDDYSSLIAGKRHRYEVLYSEKNNRLLDALRSANYVTSKNIEKSKKYPDIHIITGFVKELA